MEDNLENKEGFTLEIDTLDSLQEFSRFSGTQDLIKARSSEASKRDPKIYKFAHQVGNDQIFFQRFPNERKALQEASLNLGKLVAETSSINFNFNDLISNESLDKTKKQLQTRSGEIAKINDFQERKRETIDFLSSTDAFYAYMDLYYRGEGKNEQFIMLSDVIRDPRYRELLDVFKRAGGGALQLFDGTTKGTDLYQKAMNDAGKPAQRESDVYLTKNNIGDPDNLSSAGDKEIDELIDKYVNDPKSLNPDTRVRIGLKLRLANHTWKVGQIERQARGENGRTEREIYRIFDGIFHLPNAAEEIKKDWVHVTS